MAQIYIGIEEIERENDFTYNRVMSRIAGARQTGGGASSLARSMLVLMLRAVGLRPERVGASREARERESMRERCCRSEAI